MTDQFDLEELVHLEQTFYDAGHADGFAHGRIHGLIEGRALGREKGFEIWEEIGFYEGFAMMWKAVFEQRGDGGDHRAVYHLRHLLDFIHQFPTTNPSPSPFPQSQADEIDISRLQRQIRSRYKALCASLGVRPTLRASGTTDEAGDEDTGNHGSSGSGSARPVWSLGEDAKRPVMQGLSF
ncbi:hypothetical protein F5I97DRAFT_1249132 [Phlebopus sp. FC_14]|nr:hypothetical protein F5I97DRAFT_1249132 [Phlebopus sp. FC_14]